MQSLNRKNLILIVIIVLTSMFVLSACTQEQTIKTTQSSPDNFTWSITLDKWEIAEDLTGTESAIQYNGDVTQIQIQEFPTEGMTFLLLELTIEKQKSGAFSFAWKDVYILDEEGNKYYRHPNDTFLENYNFPRIKSTDLTIGKNEGFICFEIPISLSKQKLTLVYESPEGDFKIPLG